MNRRDTLKLMAAASVGISIPGCTRESLDQAADRVAAIGSAELATREPVALTPEEYKTVTMLVDYIIPADDRSGSASEAGVPAFIDFILEDSLSTTREIVTPFRGGLALFERTCFERYGARFADASEQERIEMLDLVAYPNDVAPDMERLANWFSTLRDLTASGFFSSRMGVSDLGYQGNTAHDWDGCPQDSLDHLGVSYT